MGEGTAKLASSKAAGYYNPDNLPYERAEDEP